MIRAALSRTLRSVLVLVAVVALTSQLAALLPGDPALSLLGYESTAEQRETLRTTLGLDQDVITRIGHTLAGVVTGDWGTSFTSGRPVLAEIWDRAPATAQLVIMSQIVALAIAVPLALRSAHRVDRAFDHVTSGANFALLAVPSFVVGVVLVYVFAVILDWLPASGYTPFSEDPGRNLLQLVLPVLTLALAEAAVYLRTLRGAAVAALREPYSLAARVRGMSPRRLLWTRVLRPASPTLAALVGLNLSVALGGTLLVESLFSIPGVGRLTVAALGARDLPMIQGVVVFAAVIIIVGGVLTDLVVSALDPRSRRGRS